jgi:peptide/nickel transport system substrate-binding protein
MTVVRIARPALAFALAAFAAFAACADRGSDAATGGTLVIATVAWHPGPPPVVVDIQDRMVADLLYDRLAEIGQNLNTIGDGGFEARLARKWTWSTDSLSVAFDIDPRARWHDGAPVRATDVRFTLAVLKDPKTGSSVTPLLSNVDSVSIRDSLTAVVWFHRRTPQQFYDFVYQVHIIPEHIWKDVPRDKLATSDQARTPIGSSRFRFMRFEPAVRLELVADTTNYRGRAKLDRVVLSFITDAGAAITQLLTGQADMFENLPPPVIPKVDSSTTVRAVPYRNLQFAYFGFNNRDPKRLSAPHPILGDRRVRRALSMALDRHAMLSNFFGARGIIGVGPLPTTLLPDSALALPTFDRAAAEALLDSAGWPKSPDGIRRRGGKPLAFAILVPASSAGRMRYAVLIQEQLKAVGVNASIESMDFAAFNDRQKARQFDAAMMATGYDPTPSSVQQGWSTAGISQGGQNFVSYSNPLFDRLMDSASASFNEARGRAIYRRAYQALVDDAPAVWLYDLLPVAGLHKRVQPVGMRADEWWANLADWWITPSERIDRDRIGLRPAAP